MLVLEDVETYINPVIDGDYPDPGVLQLADGTFVAVTTASFPIFTSPNLYNWTLRGHVFDAGNDIQLRKNFKPMFRSPLVLSLPENVIYADYLFEISKVFSSFLVLTNCNNLRLWREEENGM